MLTWIVATAAATGLAWLGVRSVVGDVADPLPAPELVAVSEPTPDPAPTGDPTAPAAPESMTFTLSGGTATVRFSPTDVAVVSAVPVAGFETDVDSDDGRTRVEFESDTHRSRLEVWWEGVPRHSIQEKAAADHDDSDDDDSDDDSDDD